jgi:hypothetical protein
VAIAARFIYQIKLKPELLMPFQAESLKKNLTKAVSQQPSIHKNINHNPERKTGKA